MYEDGYIICLINDKTYIFDDQGYFKFKSSEVITDSLVEYYSLVYTGKNEQNNYLSFVIGFISQNKLYLKLYKYVIETNTIEYIEQFIQTNHIVNNALSCHSMNYTYSETKWFKTYYYWKYIITCLYLSLIHI